MQPAARQILFGSRRDPLRVLGSDLLAWWDVERTDLITKGGGLVSSIRDIVGGYDLVQATTANKPIWSATSFNGRPGMALDGTDDRMSMTTQPFPAGAAPSEIWLLVDQPLATTVGGDDCLFCYGASTNDTRYVYRDGSTNRLIAYCGTGAAVAASTLTTPLISGKRVARGVFSATQVTAEVDATAAAPAPAVPSTGATLVRLGATPAGGDFSGSVYNTILVTNPITDAAKVAAIYAYLNARKA